MRIRDEKIEIAVAPSTGQSAVESLVSAQHGYINFQDMVTKINIFILKSWSIVVSKAPKVLFLQIFSLCINKWWRERWCFERFMR